MEHTEHSTSNNTHIDVYCQEKINIPFSWEHKPGLSKVTNNDTRHGNLVLQPPPMSSSSRSGGNKQVGVEDTEGPCVLCAVQPSSLKIKSFRLEGHKGDPFVEAYKKCTKSPKHPFMPKRSNNGDKIRNNGSWPNIKKYIRIFSCKFSGDVMSMV